MPYLTLVLFSMFVLEHAVNFKGASQSFAFVLQVVSMVGFIGVLAILIIVGIQEKWWVAILLAICGLIISGFIKPLVLQLAGRFGQFVLSLLGIIAIPLTIIIILYKILF
ncbi:MAG: hypothetical protein LCH37_05525 [Bacteroidetes bacterium]|nr:hypothetical protein [Bacteroidota bacterium]